MKKDNTYTNCIQESKANEIYVNGLNEIRESIVKCNFDGIFRNEAAKEMGFTSGNSLKNILLDIIDKELAKYN